MFAILSNLQEVEVDMALVAHAPQQSRTPVDMINEALKGSVVDVLRLFLPSLAPYTNEEAFNLILSSPEMAQRSFRAFRDHPEAFAEIVRGPENQPIASDDEELSCGRTLSQVVALVVQAVAKRYFRAKLTVKRNNRATVVEPKPFEKFLRLLQGNESPKVVVTKVVQSPGDRLFQAMRDYLLFEWQLRLIPHYVSLPVSLVEALGVRLLDFRDPEDIQWMAKTGHPLPGPTNRHTEETPEPEAAPQAPVSSMEELMAAAEAVPEGVTAQRYVSALLQRVNPALARHLSKELRLDPKQLALVMIRAYEALPSAEFQRLGAAQPDSDEAIRFVTAARSARFGTDVSKATTAEFARLYMAKVRPMMGL